MGLSASMLVIYRIETVGLDSIRLDPCAIFERGVRAKCVLAVLIALPAVWTCSRELIPFRTPLAGCGARARMLAINLAQSKQGNLARSIDTLEANASWKDV